MVDLGLEPVTLALAVKARRLASALRCDAFDAWALMARERDHAHALRASGAAARASDASGPALATVYLVPEGEVHDVPRLPGDDDDKTLISLSFFQSRLSRSLTHAQSHDEPKRADFNERFAPRHAMVTDHRNSRPASRAPLLARS